MNFLSLILRLKRDVHFLALELAGTQGRCLAISVKRGSLDMFIFNHSKASLSQGNDFSVMNCVSKLVQDSQ